MHAIMKDQDIDRIFINMFVIKIIALMNARFYYEYIIIYTTRLLVFQRERLIIWKNSFQNESKVWCSLHKNRFKLWYNESVLSDVESLRDLFVETNTYVNNDLKNIIYVCKTLEVVVWEVIDWKNEIPILCRFRFSKYKGIYEILEHYLIFLK